MRVGVYEDSSISREWIGAKAMWTHKHRVGSRASLILRQGNSTVLTLGTVNRLAPVLKHLVRPALKD